MRCIGFLTLVLVVAAPVVWGWGYNSHVGMTRAAAQFVFGLDTTDAAPKVKKFKVHIKYSMHSDFARGMGKNLSIMGGGGILESFVGSMIDMKLSKDKFAIDTWLEYPPPDSLALDTWWEIMGLAGYHPDKYDGPTGLLGEGEMTIGHIYGPGGFGFADQMCEWAYGQAVKAWKANKPNEAKVFLGYASHYLEDCGISVHAEADYRNLKVMQEQIVYHSYTEGYVSVHWDKYFQATADSAAKVPMPVCDIAATARALSMETYPDVAEWYAAWGNKGGGAEYDGTGIPANQKLFHEVVRREIWRAVPRVSGLMLKFKNEVMYP